MSERPPPLSVNASCGTRNSHSRSLSQPGFFSFDFLPPLSPFSNPTSSSLTSESNVMDVSMEGMAGNNNPVVSQPSPPVHQKTVFQDAGGLPPRTGHRRSSSDVPLGFSDMIQSSPQLMPIRVQGTMLQPPSSRESIPSLDGRSNRLTEGMSERNSSCGDDKDVASKASGTKTNSNDGSDNEVESCVKGVSGNAYGGSSAMSMTGKEGLKRSACGDVAPRARHQRSLSMDSFMENLHLGDESPKLPVTPPIKLDQYSPNSSMDGSLGKFSVDFGGSEFNEADMKKIMTDERLSEIALSDPKRVKRILANRQSAARSKERKLRYISELEDRVRTLQTESSTLSAQVTILTKNFTKLSNENNELRFRLQAMDQQAQLRNALHEALNAEVHLLKLEASERKGEMLPSNCMAQQVALSNQVFEMHRKQPTQQEQFSVVAVSSNAAANASSVINHNNHNSRMARPESVS